MTAISLLCNYGQPTLLELLEEIKNRNGIKTKNFQMNSNPQNSQHPTTNQKKILIEFLNRGEQMFRNENLSSVVTCLLGGRD